MFITKPKNRQILSWLGGGLVALAAGVWAVTIYVWPAHDGPKVVWAQQGSLASGRDASGNTITYTGGGVVARIALKHFNALTHIENAIGLQNYLICFGFNVFSAPIARSYHLGRIYVEYKSLRLL